jgi:anti-anti-sigma regulatory factor
MTREQGFVASAAGLTPHGHLGWGHNGRAEFLAGAAEFIADGLDADQRIVYIGPAGRHALWDELADTPGIDERLHPGAVGVLPSAEFYVFSPGSDVPDPESTVAKCVAAVDKAVAAGYTGLRAVVDCTEMLSTPQRRDAYARFEFLMDTKMTALPCSVLCAYDTSRLGDEVAEFVCLHPFASQGVTPLRFYFAPGADCAVAGDVDDASDALFTTTLRRLWPRVSHETLVIDAQALNFIGHRQLVTLDRLARADGTQVVLRTDERVVARLVELLDLTNVSVQPPDDHDGDTGRPPPSVPAIEQVKTLLIHDFGLSPENALRVLETFSHDTHTDLRAVAAQIYDDLVRNDSEESRRATVAAIRTVGDRLPRCR